MPEKDPAVKRTGEIFGVDIKDRGHHGEGTSAESRLGVIFRGRRGRRKKHCRAAGCAAGTSAGNRCGSGGDERTDRQDPGRAG